MAAAIFSLLFSLAARAAPIATTATANGAHTLQVGSEMYRWQEHQMYLRTLNDLHKAVTKELAVVKLMRACETMGLRCTGWGIAESILQQPAKVEDETSREAKKPQPSKAAVRRPLPEVLAVYRGRVGLLIEGRHYEAGVGDRVGNYQVERVQLDSVVVRNAGRRLVLPVRWLPGDKEATRLAGQSQ